MMASLQTTLCLCSMPRGSGFSRDWARSVHRTCLCGCVRLIGNSGFATATPPFASKLAPTRFLASRAICGSRPCRRWRHCRQHFACAQCHPRGSGFSRDWARSGHRTCLCGCVRLIGNSGFATATPPFASKLAPTRFRASRAICGSRPCRRWRHCRQHFACAQCHPRRSGFSRDWPRSGHRTCYAGVSG